MRLFALLLILVAACGSSKPVPEHAPFNLVVITIDTLRAGHLGTYGYFRDTSPALDALAAESLVFENCTVPMATTLPSHVSLFTSTFPLEHGIVANVKANGRRFQPVDGLATLAEILSAEGYDTAGFVSCTPLKPKSGIQAGFRTFDVPKAGQRRAPKTTAAASAWLAQRGAPFFLWAHYYDPHSPFDAPGAFGSMFTSDAKESAYLREREFADETLDVQGKRLVTKDALASYDGEIRFTDASIAKLLGELKSRADWDRTIVLVTADHGESLGQHDEAGHGGMWQEQVRVPLILRVPGVSPARIEAALSSVDILPTLFALADLPGGGRLLSQASGRDVLGDTGAETPLFTVTNERHLKPGVRAEYALRRGAWKYVLRLGADDALFDLVADPFELRDRLADEPERAAKLRAELAALVEAQLARGATLGAGREGADSSDELDELRALGYL